MPLTTTCQKPHMLRCACHETPWPHIKLNWCAFMMQCAARFKSVDPVSIIMVADNGTFSGTSEAVFVLGLLQNANQAPAATVPCQGLQAGTLFGQKVVVAISGEQAMLHVCNTASSHSGKLRNHPHSRRARSVAPASTHLSMLDPSLVHGDDKGASPV